MFEVIIRHHRTDALIEALEHDIHHRVRGVLSGIQKDPMTDGCINWIELKFFIADNLVSLESLNGRVFWNEIQSHISLEPDALKVRYVK